VIQSQFVRTAAVAGGILLTAIVLWDAFETMLLARRVSRRLRLTRLFYAFTWGPYSSAVRRIIRRVNQRENYLSFYGPFSILLLLAVWAAALIFGFALLEWGLALRVTSSERTMDLATYLYLSGTTFFTLGFGDVTPLTPLAGRSRSSSRAPGSGSSRASSGTFPCSRKPSPDGS